MDNTLEITVNVWAAEFAYAEAYDNYLAAAQTLGRAERVVGIAARVQDSEPHTLAESVREMRLAELQYHAASEVLNQARKARKLAVSAAYAAGINA